MRQTTLKKVQVVYYLSRNGHLEHPHYMELTHHLAHQHPTLKDVMKRLVVLRGKAMPSLYAWSCKRSYKNGYVWNDLDENDVIFPSEGGEYVLKGSEIILSCIDKLQSLQLKHDNTLHPKRKLLHSNPHPKPQQKPNNQHEGEGEEEEEEYQEKQTFKSCSRGVSTDEIKEFEHENRRKIHQTEQTIGANSSPLCAHSDNSSNTLDATISNNQNPTRFEDGDPVGIDPMLSRNSMLLSLIACGGSSSFRRSFPPAGVQEEETPARKSCSGSALHKGVVLKAAVAAAEEGEDEMMIKYMSENPRLIGNLQAEEKEYFSGSIVEAMGDDQRLGGDHRPGLKRSSSFNQERGDKVGGETVITRREIRKEKGKTKGRCIPRKKASSKKLMMKIQALH